MKSLSYWVWKFKDGTYDIDTIRDWKWLCLNFVWIKYDRGDLETPQAFLKRVKGKVVRVKLKEF